MNRTIKHLIKYVTNMGFTEAETGDASQAYDSASGTCRIVITNDQVEVSRFDGPDPTWTATFNGSIPAEPIIALVEDALH